MATFRESMIQGASDLVDQIRSHRFLVQTAGGVIPDAVFRRFATQN
jgi:thiaminase